MTYSFDCLLRAGEPGDSRPGRTPTRPTSRRLLRRIAAFAGGLSVAGGLLAASPAPAQAYPVAIPDAIAKAQVWINANGGTGVRYSNSNSDTFNGYRRDCSGFMSMIWGLSKPGLSTQGLDDASVSHRISKDELATGDALIDSYGSTVGSRHVVMFDHWLDAAHTRFTLYEQATGTHSTPLGSLNGTRYREGSWSAFDGVNDDYFPYRKNGAKIDQAPIGAFDAATSSTPGVVAVRGWAFDPDHKTTPLNIHIYVGGPAGSGAPSYNLGAASLSRTDVQQAYSLPGSKVGFSSTVHAPGGNITVYAYAINADPGDNTFLGAKVVHVVDPNPSGALDVVSSPSSGKVHVQGWAFDRSNLSSQISIHVYVGGTAGSGAPGFNLGATKFPRYDVRQVYPGVGLNTGFSATVDGPKGKQVPVYVYAINVGVGDNVLIGSKTVTVKS